MKTILLVMMFISAHCFAVLGEKGNPLSRELIVVPVKPVDDRQRLEEAREVETLNKMTTCRFLIEKVDEIKDIEGVKAVLKCIK